MTSKSQTTLELGFQWLDSISIPEEKLNLLFTALFLTSVSIFVGSNLQLRNVQILLTSLKIALPCWGMMLIFYMLSRSAHSVIWGLVLTYALILMLVVTRQTWLVPVGYLISLVGLGYTLRFLRVERAQWLTILLMAVLASATILGVNDASSPRFFGTFDTLQRLLVGDLTQDTLFHASLAAMIKNYGVVSTGLHGLVETPYHILSHMLFAGFSRLSGMGVIEVYGVAHWIFFAPLLVFGISSCVGMLDQVNRLRLPLVWLFSSVLLTVIPLLLEPWAVWDTYFVSESYLVALGLILPGFALLFKRRLSLLDILLAMLLTLLMSMAKMSVGPIFTGLWLVRILFVRGKSAWRDLLALILSACAAVWVLFTFAGSIAGDFRISPLSFLVSYSFLGDVLLETGGAALRGGAVTLRMGLLSLISILSFFIFHFLLNWLLVARVAFRDGIRVVFTIPMTVYTLAVALVGVAVMLVIQLPSINNYWFSNVAFIVALPGVVSWLGQASDRWKLPTRPLLVSCILLVGLINIRNYPLSAPWNSEYNDVQPNQFITALIEEHQTAPLNEVLRPLDAVIDDNPVRGCSAAVFVYPAVSERPWVDVVGRQGACHYGSYYSFAEYGITDEHPTVAVPVRLLPGMVIRDWSYSPADSQQP